MGQHPAMIYRVQGTRADGSESFVDVECRSEAVARNVAVRNGIVNTSGVEVISRDLAVDPFRPARTTRSAGQQIFAEHSVSGAAAFKAGFFLTLGILVALFIAWIGKVLLGALMVSTAF